MSSNYENSEEEQEEDQTWIRPGEILPGITQLPEGFLSRVYAGGTCYEILDQDSVSITTSLAGRNRKEAVQVVFEDIIQLNSIDLCE
jgi:hypothetical protein